MVDVERVKAQLCGCVTACEYILALFYAAGGTMPSRAAVHEAAYRLQVELDEPVFDEFIQYPRGLWSPIVAEALDMLMLNGMLKRANSKLKLTEKGAAKASEIYQTLSERQRRAVEKAVGRK